jgi:DNA helicase-2/ATP-dependent DNA helicase PcrA
MNDMAYKNEVHMNWDYNLSPEQRVAASHIGSHARLLAGPGTGKTLVLTRRVIYLISKSKIQPNDILALTFTRAAAKELRQRITSELADEVGSPTISTLHSFALKTLLLHGAGRRLPNPIRIADDWEERNIIEEDLKTILELNDVRDARNKLKELSSDWEQLTADQADYRFPDPKFQGAWQEHRQIFGYTLRAELVFQLKHSLEEGIVQLDQLQKQILVDEYQDLNPCDLAVVRALTNARAELYAAGDDDQSIYGFRFADPEGIRRFPREYDPASLLTLQECQRCGSQILSISDYVAKQDTRRTPKILNPVSNAQQGEVQILNFANQYREAEGIAQICRWLIEKRNLPPEEILILLRGDRYGVFSTTIRESLEQLKLPVGIVTNPLECLDHDDGRIFLSILRLVVNVHDHLAWRTLFQKRKGNGFGEVRLRKMYELAHSRGENFAQLIFNIANDPNQIPELGSRIADEFANILAIVESSRSAIDLKGLIDGIYTVLEQIVIDPALRGDILTLFKRVADTVVPNDLDDLLRAINVSLGNEEQEQQNGAVNIMTMHQAKGLTATAVIIVGAEDEYIPGRAQGREVDDERRLLYVSLTRARQFLYITHCQNRLLQQLHTGKNAGVTQRMLTQFLSGGPIRSESGTAYIRGLS